MTKKPRQITVSGPIALVVPSHARPHKLAAKEISRRKKAALGSRGGKLPPALRRKFERDGVQHRVKVLPADPHQPPASTRAGKKKPDMARYAVAVEARDRREERKSRTPETEPGANAGPATRIPRNEPKPGKHRPK